MRTNLRVIRYLNGQPLHGTMPQMVLSEDGAGAILRDARRRQELPLLVDYPSAILNAEETDLGKDVQ